jgi:hypothetical protein
MSGPGVRLAPRHRQVDRPQACDPIQDGGLPGHLAILAEAHISRGRPTDPHGATLWRQQPALLLLPSVGTGEVAMTVLWFRTIHFGPGKVGPPDLPTSALWARRRP